jgi:lipopolysaccharide/colanic/teichoic acid biosynthesis glycosyltransferase/carbonic anhydrase/acetyltransferase-like protein (isoleucine patch superfamily)
VTAHPPIVVSAAGTAPNYETALRVACARIESFVTPATLRELICGFDPSDSLLVMAANIQPVEPMDLRLILGEISENQMIRHLLAFEASSTRTKEFVHSGDGGRVRRIQRYFDPVTWPFPAGVIASLIPVACLHTGTDVSFASLEELRRSCSGRGFPSRDIRYYGPCFDLHEAEGALALAERNVMIADRSPESKTSPLRLFGSVHPTARVFGPVSIGVGVTLEEGALVIGPAVLGDRCRIRSNAVVAQCLVLPAADVAAGVTIRQRVVIDRPVRHAGRADQPQRRNVNWSLPPHRESSVTNAPDFSYQLVKRVIDATIAFGALTVLSPILGIMAALVKLDSRGPAFFGHLREGRHGKSFRCWKFRTMRPDADAMQRTLASQQKMDGPQFKMADDPRVTTVGKWLRKLNVDELPQLLNVLLGQMSLVGPRPSPFRENQICVPWRNGRLSVRPGITGLWQICRRDRDEGDFHQWIHYDLLYVRNANLWVDLKIIVATVISLAGRTPVSLSRIIRVPSEAASELAWSEPPVWAEAPPPLSARLAVAQLADVSIEAHRVQLPPGALDPWHLGKDFPMSRAIAGSHSEPAPLGMG